LVAAAKFVVTATKYLFVVPDFVAVTKPFFRAFNGLVTMESRRKFDLKQYLKKYLPIFSGETQKVQDFNNSYIYKEY